MNTPAQPHYFDYCSHCQRAVAICGQCGNNTCNGGYGEIIGPEPGTFLPCPYCIDAYKMDLDSTFEK